MRVLILALLATSGVWGAEWRNLFPGGSMAEWDVVGDGLWRMQNDGTLVAMRSPEAAVKQSWLYTKQEFGEFDLRLQYWNRWGGNSGVSIRDKTRAAKACGAAWVAEETPSHHGYEIQIISGDEASQPSGSIYLFQKAVPNIQKDFDWNLLEIQSRKKKITIFLNGVKVAEHRGDPKRPVVGPIGLQLHDAESLIQFRGVQIKERK